MILCQECRDAPAAHEDPRNSPLDDGYEVLCTPCYALALEEVMVDSQRRAIDAHKQLEKINQRGTHNGKKESSGSTTA